MYSSCPRGKGGVWRARMMASSVDLFNLYANYSRSSESGRDEMMKVLTNRPKHFMIVDVSVTGQ